MTRAQSGQAASWKLEDAKAKFSEVVRRANSEGPQTVTVRGKEAAVVVSADQFARLQPHSPQQPLLDFLRSVDLSALDLTRDPDFGRDIDF